MRAALSGRGRRIPSLALMAISISLPLASFDVSSKVSAEQAARLGKDLTPVGALALGSADGRIPAYAGGTPRQGVLDGSEYPSNRVLESEKPLFTITAGNMAQHERYLTRGHQELLRRYPTYRMPVYPSYRPVRFPEHITAATRLNATRAELEGTDTVKGAVHGFPFPIPASGAEVIWNHKVRWRGHYLRRFNNQLIVQPSGEYLLTRLLEDVVWSYTNPKHDGRSEDILFKYRATTLSPPRVAGEVLLVHETSNQKTTPRLAWQYNPGLDRVNRAPTVGYDNFSSSTDGNQFYDQIDMYNGALDRYSWKLLGKREVYIPYNSYRTANSATRYADMVRRNHFNPDITRYELHRVWVVEATLHKSLRHAFQRRMFYVDEDSWAISAIDCYDSRGQLYKFQEAHQVFVAAVQGVGGLPEVIYDFSSGRYFVTALTNEDRFYDWTVKFEQSYFLPTALRKSGARQ